MNPESARRSNAVRSGLRAAVLVAGLGVLFAGVPTVRAADGPAASSLTADLGDAQKLLEGKKYAAFMEKFAPADELRRIRQADAMSQAERTFTQRPEAAKKLLDLLQALKTQKPRFDGSGGYAVFEFEPGPPPKVEEPVKPVLKPGPKIGPKPPDGYGNDLKAVLAAALKALETEDYSGFTTKLFPVSEAVRLQPMDEATEFSAKLKQLPEVRKRMIEDLKAAQKLTPEMTGEGTIATFVLKADEAPERRLRFQKVGNDWRLFDGTEQVTETIESAPKVETMPTRTRVRVEFEKLGGNWRFVEWKL